MDWKIWELKLLIAPAENAYTLVRKVQLFLDKATILSFDFQIGFLKMIVSDNYQQNYLNQTHGFAGTTVKQVYDHEWRASAAREMAVATG